MAARSRSPSGLDCQLRPNVESRTAPDLCTVCERIVKCPRPHWDGSPARGGAELGLLRKSVQEGCPTCGLLWRVTALFSKLDYPDTDSIYMDAFQIMLGKKGERHSVLLVSLAANGKKPSPPWDWLQCVKKSPLSRTPLRDTENIRRWLAECSQHPNCPSQGDADSPLPHRVIDVGDEAHDPFLYVTKGESARYVALSHRWGTSESPASKSLLTTKENLPGFRSRIPLDLFPNTFLEAVRATRLIGVRYLWIDSICIIQNDDDGRDWEIESSVMDQIYSKAFVTISADRAKHEDDGLFSSPKEILKVIQEVEHVDNSSGERIPILVSAANFPFGTVEHEFCLAGRMDKGHLWDRGWVFQEEVLSPRTVHFTSTELVWQCRTIHKCDCQIPRDEIEHFNDKPENQKKALMSFSMNPNSTWTRLVSKYAKLNLTYESDRLPALSGIASSTGRNPEDYLAGIWRQEVAEQLCWATRARDGKGERSKRNTNYAPSWSWTSVIGSIIFHSNIYEIVRFWTVLDADCIPSGKNPFGSVSSGWVRVRGPILNVRVRQVKRPVGVGVSYRWIEDENFKDHLEVSCEVADSTERWQLPPTIRCRQDAKVAWADIYNPQNRYRALIEGVIKYGIGNEYDRDEDRPVCGLLLVNSKDKEGCWERLGSFHEASNGMKWKSWKMLAREDEVIIV